jgi:HK97 family phage major capsid protein
MPAPSTSLVEQREQFATKQKLAADVFELAQDGTQFDLSRKTVLEKLGATDANDALGKLKALNRECDDLGAALHTGELQAIKASIGERQTQIDTPYRGAQHPSTPGGEAKTWGQLYVESKEFKGSRQSRTDMPFVLEIGLKTLFETAAGFAPESVRSGLLVEKATRPIQVLDLIPTFPISQPSFVYMEETTRTHAAVEKAEGAAYPESTFVWAQKSSPVQKIPDSIPVTDEQLEDEGQVRSLLEQRLSFGLRQRLDGQILVGNGTPPNLRGLLNVVGIQTFAKGGDMGIVAFMKGLTLVRYTGRASPSGAIAHPNDWQDLVLTQDNQGRFLFGNPFQGVAPQSLFGTPVAVSDGLTENSLVIGDFANFSRLDDRRGVMVQTGYVGTQFTEGKVTLRADLRAAITYTRPAAFVSITGM